MNIKAIIFDFDDTLFQTKKVKLKAFQYWLKEFYNKDLTVDEIASYWGIPFNKFVEALKGEEDSVDTAIEKYFSILPQFVTQPFPGVLEGLEVLSKKYVLGIVSSASKELVKGDMQRANFPDKFFSYIQGCGETTVHKPDPEVFTPTLTFLANLHIQKEEVIYIGDTKDDFFAAKKAGIRFIAMADHGVSANVWQSIGSEYVKDLQQLIKVL